MKREWIYGVSLNLTKLQPKYINYVEQFWFKKNKLEKL